MLSGAWSLSQAHSPARAPRRMGLPGVGLHGIRSVLGGKHNPPPPPTAQMLKGTRREHGELLKQDVSAGTTDDPDGAPRSVPRDGGAEGDIHPEGLPAAPCDRLINRQPWQ